MILITEFMDEGAVDRLRPLTEVIYDKDLVDRPDDLTRQIASAKALIVRNRTKVTDALMASAGQLACVGRLGVGLDNIDLEAAKARGVAVYPATGANDRSVAEYVIGVAMTLLRGAYQRTGAVVAGEWPRAAATGREVAGKTLGLVGFGGTAQETARLGAALGMSVIAHDPVAGEDERWRLASRVPFDELLERADIVSLHVPLTDATRHMIGAAELASMKRDAVLINAARGGVVHEMAVVAALTERVLGGAALDVFEGEPLDEDAGAAFADVPNLILTPHIAGVTAESNVRVSSLIAERVAAHLGLPIEPA